MRLSVSVRLYVLGRFHFLNFSILILKIAFSILAFQLPVFPGFSSPRFGTAKVTTFFYFANFIFFYFFSSLFPASLSSFLLRLRAAKMQLFSFPVKCLFHLFFSLFYSCQISNNSPLFPKRAAKIRRFLIYTSDRE